MIDSILQNFTNLLCNYGTWAAGLFSGHGTYEEVVPDELAQMFTKE